LIAEGWMAGAHLAAEQIEQCELEGVRFADHQVSFFANA